MFFSCASVSFTLVGVTDAVCGLVSDFAEQPANATLIAAAAATASAGRRVLFFMIFIGQVRAVPPATAERLKQCRCIGIATGLRLHQVDHALLIGLFGV